MALDSSTRRSDDLTDPESVFIDGIHISARVLCAVSRERLMVWLAQVAMARSNLDRDRITAAIADMTSDDEKFLWNIPDGEMIGIPDGLEDLLSELKNLGDDGAQEAAEIRERLGTKLLTIFRGRVRKKTHIKFCMTGETVNVFLDRVGEISGGMISCGFVEVVEGDCGIGGNRGEDGSKPFTITPGAFPITVMGDYHSE